MVPITGQARSFLLVFKNKIERRGDRIKTPGLSIYPTLQHSPQTLSTPPNPNLYHTK